MSLIKSQSDLEFDRLMMLIKNSIPNTPPMQLAGLAYMQAVGAHSVCSALIKMLRQQNVISPALLETYLRDAYREMADALIKNSQGTSIPATPPGKGN